MFNFLHKKSPEFKGILDSYNKKITYSIYYFNSTSNGELIQHG